MLLHFPLNCWSQCWESLISINRGYWSRSWVSSHNIFHKCEDDICWWPFIPVVPFQAGMPTFSTCTRCNSWLQVFSTSTCFFFYVGTLFTTNHKACTFIVTDGYLKQHCFDCIACSSPPCTLSSYRAENNKSLGFSLAGSPTSPVLLSRVCLCLCLATLFCDCLTCDFAL